MLTALIYFILLKGKQSIKCDCFKSKRSSGLFAAKFSIRVLLLFSPIGEKSFIDDNNYLTVPLNSELSGNFMSPVPVSVKLNVPWIAPTNPQTATIINKPIRP